MTIQVLTDRCYISANEAWRRMTPGADRILTTHVGSLPRSDALVGVLNRMERGDDVPDDELVALLEADQRHVLREQARCGVDIVGNGELPRIGFSNYVKDRMTGFGGHADRGTQSDYLRFPKFAELKLEKAGVNAEQHKRTATEHPVPQAQRRVAYDPTLAAVKRELTVFDDALDEARARGDAFTDTFVTAASPGIISTTLLRSPDNPVYADDRAYLIDLAHEMRVEYDCIVERGHRLQIDAPDLAFERQLMFRDRPLREFLKRIELHVEILNEALRGIPKHRVRMHVCWGNSESPHAGDVEIEPLLPILYEAQVGAISIPGANPRHEHEYKVFRKHPLPDGVNLIPGVIDVTYNYLEHPEVVADRICRFAEAVGDPSRIIASTDCGFSTFAGYVMVAEDVAWAKLEALRDGAELATERLWG
jgi:5-methyltetrahydropteroyltriglutamate--homocysteine methyltransferase